MFGAVRRSGVSDSSKAYCVATLRTGFPPSRRLLEQVKIRKGAQGCGKSSRCASDQDHTADQQVDSRAGSPGRKPMPSHPTCSGLPMMEARGKESGLLSGLAHE